MKKIAITMGDPAGVGPEIILKALSSNTFEPQNYVLIGSQTVLENTAKQLGLKLNSKIEIIDISCDLSEINPGIQTAESGRASFLALEKACQLAKSGLIKAIVTAPLSKKAINMAGYYYSGQTEVLHTYLGKSGSNNGPEMLFVAGDFRVMLLTRHIELNDISSFLNVESIINSILALNNSLINDFNIDKPKITICGLNPHAGEDGLLGREEINIIIPALDILRKNFNICIEGPYPADTIWIKAGRACVENKPQAYDAYVSCYHDQGLIPIKLLALDSTVNTTINLPIIRTSPSHGTAFDISGKNIANPNSMIEAVKLADYIASQRLKKLVK